MKEGFCVYQMRKYISIFSLVLQYNNCATGGILMLLSLL